MRCSYMDICIKGASQNTLKHINLTLPAGKLIALMGPSGSGKSTLAYDTLFAESRRRFLNCLSTGARRLLARPEKPHVDAIEGLPPALCLEQHLPPAHSRAILGTITEIADYLRIIYSAAGIPHDPVTGEALTRLSPEEIALSLAKNTVGTRLTLLAPLPTDFGQQMESDVMHLRKQGYLRVRVNGTLMELEELEHYTLPSEAVCELVVDRIVVKDGTESRIADSVQAALRLCPDELRVLIQEQGKEPTTQSFYTRYRNAATGFAMPDLSPRLFSHYSAQGVCSRCDGLGWIERKNGTSVCPDCRGFRLNPIALAVKLPFGDSLLNIGEFCEQTIETNVQLLKHIQVPSALKIPLEPILGELRQRLNCLTELGLEYLTLSRSAASLSGGELQRARLAGQIGGGLSGVLYILDEPTIGLHPRETAKLIHALKRLRDKGNTILVIEHDSQLLKEADWLIEMGPGSGPDGGNVLHAGTYQQFLHNEASPTGAWLSGRKAFSPSSPTDVESGPWAELRHAGARNLKDITFRLPLGAFSCLSGPSGSGKSTLVYECLLPALKAGKLRGAESLERAVVLDQSPLGVSPRSTPATHTGLLDVLRPLYAGLPLSRQRGYSASRFSLATRGGRCERCGGTGLLQVDMNFLADLYTPCDACHGSRYNRETLEVTWRGKSIAQALAQTVDEALSFFDPIPGAKKILQALHDLGLGYLTLDRAVATLSGGEAQRIRIATHLSKAGATRSRRVDERLLFVLDEPSTGLHFAEVDLLLQALFRLRDAGHTILCIEHNQSILRAADYLTELGPAAGQHGGSITYAGKPCGMFGHM